jgi:uncharacterized phage-associated protein
MGFAIVCGMYSARSIANSMLSIARESGDELTNMELQKLVYFAHGWYLALTGDPLLEEAVKAWNFGPVIPPLYNRLKRYGNGVVEDYIKEKDPITGEEVASPEPQDAYTRSVLLKVWQVYGHMDGVQMSYLTHKEGTPWYKTWQKEKYGVIPNELIRDHFRELKTSANA